MSDSVDRVFTHALATVRRLPRTGSSRPPPSSRLLLYGLYKQSMEGDVSSILPRPTLPVSTPDPSTSNSNGRAALDRYGSRDLRTREAQAEIEKWDAWDACKGMTRTEAKRAYISTLIDTMKEYASGTAESRELVGELEFVWSQIRSQSGSDPEISPRGSERERGSGSLGASFGSAAVAAESSGMMGLSRQSTRERATQKRLKRTESGLRVLSPISQKDSDSVVEGVDVEEEGEEGDQGLEGEGDEDGDEDNMDTAPSSPLAKRSARRNSQQQPPPPLPDIDSDNNSLAQWQHNLEHHLRALQTEIAALREQLSANHLLSSSSYSHTYYTMNTTQRIIHRVRLYLQMIGGVLLKQVMMQFGVLLVVLIWGRLNNDLRVEMKVREFTAKFLKRLRYLLGGAIFWLMDFFGPEGRLRIFGKILRIF